MDTLKRKRPEGGFGPIRLNHSSARHGHPVIKRRPLGPPPSGPPPSGPPRMYPGPGGPGRGHPRQRPPLAMHRPPRPLRPYGDPSSRPRQPIPPREGMHRIGRGAGYMSRPPMRPHGLHAGPRVSMNNRMRLPMRVPLIRGPLRGPMSGAAMPNNIRPAARTPPPRYHDFGNRRAPPPQYYDEWTWDEFCEEYEPECFDEEHVSLANEAVPTIDSGDSVNAANQNPDEVLLKLRPETTFKVHKYGSSKGNVYCYKVAVDGAEFEAEASTPLIAKRLVSFDALIHLQVPAVMHCNKICDLRLEAELCVANRTAHILEKVDEYVKTCESDCVKMVSKDCKKAQIKGSMLTMKPTAKYFNNLKRIYGYGKVDKHTRFLGQNGQAGVRCTIQHNGEQWVGTGTTKLAAKNHAAHLIMAYYKKHPPVKFNKYGLQRAKECTAVEERFAVDTIETEALTFSDKLVQKAFITTQDLLKDIVIPYKLQRNFACIFKITGKVEGLIDNCEVVAVGNGSKIIDKANIKSNGTVIRDCSGEILAYRAFKRYLLNQIESCIKGDISVFIKEDSGKFALKEHIKFHFFTNYSPFGDMANGSKRDTGESTAQNNIPAGLINRYLKYKDKRMEDKVECEYKPGDVGKIQQYIHAENHKRSLTAIPSSDNLETLHQIVSPSDKMALRARCGCQGALLSLLLKEPVFFSQYHIGKSLAYRHHDADALRRGLYKRLEGGQYDKPGPHPVINTTEWYFTYSERCQPYCFLWSQGSNLEVLRGPEGLAIPLLRNKPHDDDQLNSEEVQAIADQEVISAEPSRYNTSHFFNNYKLICKLLDIPVSDISSMKSSAELYNKNKAAVYNEFKNKGLGEWPNKFAPTTKSTVTSEDKAAEENTAEENTAEENTAEENTAEDNTAEENTAEENTAEENTAEENTAEENTAEENMAEENTAEENMAEENTTDENTTEENTTEENTAEEMTEDVPSEDKMSEDKMSEDQKSEDKKSEDKKSEDKKSEDIMSENKTSEDMTSEDKMSEDKTSEEKTSKDKTSKKKTSKDKTSKDKTSKAKTSKDKVV